MDTQTLQLGSQQVTGYRVIRFPEIYKASIQWCLYSALLLNDSTQDEQVIGTAMVLPEARLARRPQVIDLRRIACYGVYCSGVCAVNTGGWSM